MRKNIIVVLCIVLTLSPINFNIQAKNTDGIIYYNKDMVEFENGKRFKEIDELDNISSIDLVYLSSRALDNNKNIRETKKY